MKKYIAIIVFCLFSLVSYSQVIYPLKWGMTKEEVTKEMKNNNCYLDSLDNASLVTFDIVSYCNFQVDGVVFRFNDDYKYGLTSILLYKKVNTLKEAINLRDEWMKHFSSYYEKFMSQKYIAYNIFDDNNNYIGIIGMYKGNGNKYTVTFINKYR